MKTEQCESYELTSHTGRRLVVELTHKIIGDLVEANVSFSGIKMIDPHTVDCEWEDSRDRCKRGVFIHFFPEINQEDSRVNEPYLLIRVRDATGSSLQVTKIRTRKPSEIENAMVELRSHYLPTETDSPRHTFTPLTPAAQL